MIRNEVPNVCSVSLKLNSYSKRDDDPLSVQQVLIKLQEIISDAGGFMHQFLINENGCVLTILWDMSGSTFSNNGCQALICSVALHTFITSVDHSASIGITIRSVYCDIIGSTCRQPYLAIGILLHLASLLMHRARLRIFVDQNTLDNLLSEIIDHFDEQEKIIDFEFDFESNSIRCHRLFILPILPVLLRT